MSHATERSRRRLSVTIVLTAVLATAGLVWGIASAVAASEQPDADALRGERLALAGQPPRRRSRCGSARPSTPTTSTRSSATAAPPTRSSTSTTTSSSATTPDLSPRPELATSWTTSPDGKTWTFQLRQGVKWQDGEPFTSKDVAFTYNLIIKNNLTAFTSYTNNIIKVVPQGDFAVQMICTKPKANMLRLWIPILPEHIWAKVPPASAAHVLHQQAADHRHRALPDGRGQEGRVHQARQEPGLLDQGQAHDRRARDRRSTRTPTP